MKTFITACAAVIAFIGVNHPTVTVKAAIEERGTIDVVKNDLTDNVILIDETMQILEQKNAALPLSTLIQVDEDQPIEPKVEIKKEEPAEPAISLTTEEKDLLARLVEAEAKGEPFEGKEAVATVVLNRVESPEFPDTVRNVITEVVGNAYAFSPVQNGEINKPASEESKQAVDEALTRDDRLHDSIYFYNPEIATDNWIRSREVVTSIGNHVFAK